MGSDTILGLEGFAAVLVSKWILRPDEMQLLADLEAGGLSAVAQGLGLTRQGAHKRVHALARRLDAGGYNGSILRLLAPDVGRGLRS